MWPFVSILLVTGIICLVLPDIFKSTATVLIQNQQIPSALVPSTVTGYAQERIQAITQEVTSRSKILRLTEKYDLLPDKREKLNTEDLVEAVRKRISFQTINAEINKETQSQPVLLTIAFSLSYEDESPKKAQAVTNEIVSYYLEKNLESRQKVARGTTEFLTEQLNQEKMKMEELQTKLAEFQKQHLEELPEYAALNVQKLERLNLRISDLGMQIRSLEGQRSVVKGNQDLLDPYSGNSQKVLSSSERLLQARLDHAQALSRYSESHPFVQAKKQEIELLEAQMKGSPRPDQLIDKLHELEGKLAGLKSHYTDQHPDVRATEREIQRIKSQISLSGKEGQFNSNTVPAATNPAYISLKAEMEKLSASISSLKAEKAQLESELKGHYAKMRSMPLVKKQYTEMDTEYQSVRDNYNTIQQKLMAARVSQGMEEDKKGESFQVVEPAFLPEKPFRPNRIAFLVVGLVLGIGFSVGSAALKEASDRTIHDDETAEKLSGLPIISRISKIATSEDVMRSQRRKLAVGAASVCGIVAILLAFHLFVMDFDILYAKMERLVQKKIP
jgi:uncharacterized protein involved in exopolysaccharide biosynthesis